MDPSFATGPGQQPIPHSTTPLVSNHSILSLDVLRGVGILAGLFISIWLFGGLTENQQNGLLLQSKGGDHYLYVVASGLLEGKMRGLVALVFGAAMLSYLFVTKENRQLLRADFFIRRQLWLMLFGLFNGLVLLSTHDLLFHLGIMGVLLFPFIRLSARGLFIAAMLTMLIYAGKNYWQFTGDQEVYSKYKAVLAVEQKIKKDSAAKMKSIVFTGDKAKDSLLKKQYTDTLTKQQRSDKQAWEGLVANVKYDSKKDEGQNRKVQNTSYAKVWDALLQVTEGQEASWTYRTGIWALGCMIFLGMCLFRFGFFEAGFSTRRHWMIIPGCLVPGLLFVWFRLHYAQLALRDYEKYISRISFPYDILFPLEIVLLTVAYAAIIVLLLRTSFFSYLWKGLALAGRMALSNYLLQSFLCTLFFTGFGLGYYARLSQWQLYFVAVDVMLINIAFSYLWLRHFETGPAEWLIRCLVYWQWLKNRKPSAMQTLVTPSSEPQTL